jgi:hypothetical protein
MHIQEITGESPFNTRGRGSARGGRGNRNYNSRQSQYQSYQNKDYNNYLWNAKQRENKKEKETKEMVDSMFGTSNQQPPQNVNPNTFSNVNTFQSSTGKSTWTHPIAQTNPFATPAEKNTIPGLAPVAAIQHPVFTTAGTQSPPHQLYTFKTGMVDTSKLTLDDGSAITVGVQKLVHEASALHYKLFGDLLPDIESRFLGEQAWATDAVWRWVEVLLKDCIAVMRQNECMKTTVAAMFPATYRQA